MEGHPEDSGGEEYTERSVPDPFEGHHDSSGQKNPEPCGGNGDGAAGDLLREVVEREGGCGRKQCVQQNRDEEATNSEGSEDSKNQRQEKRIDRREPCRGSGILAKEIAEAFSLRESESDVAGFLFERNGSENLLGDFALLVQDQGDARSESSSGDEPDGG